MIQANHQQLSPNLHLTTCMVSIITSSMGHVAPAHDWCVGQLQTEQFIGTLSHPPQTTAELSQLQPAALTNRARTELHIP